MSASAVASAAARGSIWRAILSGGLAVGVLDIASAIIFWRIYRGVVVTRVLQSVAAGLLGREAASQGGMTTAALGLSLHFFIAFVVAAVYVAASTKLPSLRRRWLACGMAYGLVVYGVMNYIVLPLAGLGAPRFLWPTFLFGVIGHILTVGLPAAFFARRAA